MAQFEREKEQQKHREKDKSEEVEVLGFDALAGKSWIYPTNYPVRQYQVISRGTAP